MNNEKFLFDDADCWTIIPRAIGLVTGFSIEQGGWSTHTESHLTLCEGFKTDGRTHAQGRGFLCGSGDVGQDIRFITVFIRVSRDERKSLCIRTSRRALRFSAFIKVKWSCKKETVVTKHASYCIYSWIRTQWGNEISFLIGENHVLELDSILLFVPFLAFIDMFVFSKKIEFI